MTFSAPEGLTIEVEGYNDKFETLICAALDALVDIEVTHDDFMQARTQVGLLGCFCQVQQADRFRFSMNCTDRGKAGLNQNCHLTSLVNTIFSPHYCAKVCGLPRLYATQFNVSTDICSCGMS